MQSIVILKFQELHSKAKGRAPAYSQALRQIKRVVQWVVHGKLRFDFQRVREDLLRWVSFRVRIGGWMIG